MPVVYDGLHPNPDKPMTKCVVCGRMFPTDLNAASSKMHLCKWCRRIPKKRGAKPEFWTPEEDLQIKRWQAGEIDIKQLATIIDRSESAIRNRAIRLGYERHRAYKLWTQDEDELLFEMRENGKPIAEIAISLGRSVSGVSNRIAQLGLPKKKPGRKPQC